MESDIMVDAETSSRCDEIRKQLEVERGRDPQLWSILLLTLLVVASGVMVARDSHFVSQGIFGLVGLVALFNVYMVDQRRTLVTTRLQLMQELVTNNTLTIMSHIDPLTQAINRQSMDVVVGRELTRANRLGTEVTFLLLEARQGRRPGSDVSAQQTDPALLAGAGKLMRTTFRGLDIVVRYSYDTFLIVMPDTNQQQSEIALGRLGNEIDTWNLSNAAGLELVFSHGMASYVKGAQLEEVIRSAARKIVAKKNASAPFLSFLPGGLAMSTPQAELVGPSPRPAS
jgi:diguanylate cyclase (GGDEF)-like protein